MATRRISIDQIAQNVYIEDNGSNKVSNVWSVGMNISSTNISSAPFEVGKGSILMIRITAATYLAFDADPTTNLGVAITSAYNATQVIELFNPGVYAIACPADWVRASSNPARTEWLQA